MTKATSIMENAFTSTVSSASQKFGKKVEKKGHVGFIFKSLTFSLLFSASVGAFAGCPMTQAECFALDGNPQVKREFNNIWWRSSKTYAKGEIAGLRNGGGCVFYKARYETRAPITERGYWKKVCSL